MGRKKSLTWTQRLQIETLNNAKKTKKEIAQLLGLHLCTIYRELKRGECTLLNGSTWKYYKTYSANRSQDRYDLLCTKKGRPIKLGNDYEFVNYIEKRVVKDKISACAALGEIKRNNMPFKTDISKTTLYRYIRLGFFPSIKLLPRKKEYKKVFIKRISRGVSIEKRPTEINKRLAFGHWEGDCVCGPTKTCLFTMSERLTRLEIIFKIERQTQQCVLECINSLERKYKNNFSKIFKSITFDNGSEFLDHISIEKSQFGDCKRTQAYYCHPYCSSERGTNERLNREIRRMIPKGSDISKYSVNDIKHVEDWINHYPRAVLGYATSAELFEKELQKLA